MKKKNGASLDKVLVEFLEQESMHGYLVPLEDLKFLPRVGDFVTMPGESASDLHYEVVEVNHNFAADLATKGEMRLLSINVSLKKPVVVQ
jgi:hypothetical protein